MQAVSKPIDLIATVAVARCAVSVGPPSSWITEKVVYCNEENAACSEVLTGRHVTVKLSQLRWRNWGAP
jgi:hypothetical protein